MTEDQRKKYEEAAKAHANTLFPGIQTSETHRHHNACVEDFMAGWQACSKDTEERVKQLQDENKRLREALIKCQDEIRDLCDSTTFQKRFPLCRITLLKLLDL